MTTERAHGGVRGGRPGGSAFRRALPWTVGLAVMLLGVALWMVLREQERLASGKRMRTAAARTQAAVEAHVAEIGDALSKLAAHTEMLRSLMLRLEALRPVVRESWAADAQRLLEEHRDVVAIEFVSPDGEWRAGVPLPAGVEDPRDASPLAPTAICRAAFAAARETRHNVVSEPFDLPDGAVGIRIIAPVFRGEEVDALLSAVVRADRMIAAVVDGSEGMALLVTAGRYTIYPSAAPGEITGWQHATDLRLPGGTGWRVRMATPPAAGLAAWVYEIVLAAVIVAGGLLVASLHAADTARDRACELGALTQELEERVAARTSELATANAGLRAENALRERAQAEMVRSNEDLRQFAALVSHELRQPLATMQLWSDLLAESAGPALGEQGRSWLAKLAAAITRMTELVEGELRLAAVAYADAARRPVELREVVEAVLADLAPERERVGARVEVGALPVVDADPAQMGQLFRNLIENALKYRRADVPLVVAVESDPDASADAAGMAAVRVRDNGRGFPPEAARDVFAMFRRLDPGGGSGSGVGLAICRRIVERHGGTITAEGRPGEGAIFHVVLPRALAAPAPQSAAI